jgi:hypothetical protein
VLILESGDSTNVIEPTEVVVLGSGFLSQQTSVRFQIEGTVVAGQQWVLTLTQPGVAGGASLVENYSYTVPSTGSPTLTTIAQGLAALANPSAAYAATANNQAGNATNYLTLSSGTPFNVYLKRGDGTQIFIGDFGSAIVRELGIQDSVFLAQDIDTAKWNRNANANIENATTVPHLTGAGHRRRPAGLLRLPGHPGDARP